MSAPHPITTLLFDLDGTLVDSYAPICESLNTARAAFGLPPHDLSAVRAMVGHGLESLIASNVGSARTDAGVVLFRERYRSVFRQGTHALPGAAATLRTLAGLRFRMGIVSNKPAYFTREILVNLGFGTLFGAVWGPERVTRPKPDPEMLLCALEELGSQPGEALAVGDMPIDISAARAAGMRVCAVPTGSASADELRAAGPDYFIEGLESLLSLLR